MLYQIVRMLRYVVQGGLRGRGYRGQLVCRYQTASILQLLQQPRVVIEARIWMALRVPQKLLPQSLALWTEIVGHSECKPITTDK